MKTQLRFKKLFKKNKMNKNQKNRKKYLMN